MFWIMMYALLFGGAANPDAGLLPGEEAFRKAIKDPARLEQVLEVREDAAAIEEEREEAVKAGYEKLEDLTMCHDASPTEFDAVFSALDEARETAGEALLEARFRMREKMTRKEWERTYGGL